MDPTTRNGACTVPPVQRSYEVAVETGHTPAAALPLLTGIGNGEMKPSQPAGVRPAPSTDWVRALRWITTLAALGAVVYWSFGRSNFAVSRPEDSAAEPVVPPAAAVRRANWASFEQLMRKAWG